MRLVYKWSMEEKRDWAKAEKIYITDPKASYATIATFCGVSQSAVRNHALKGNWRAKRKNYQELRACEPQPEPERVIVEQTLPVTLRDTEGMTPDELEQACVLRAWQLMYTCLHNIEETDTQGMRAIAYALKSMSECEATKMEAKAKSITVRFLGGEMDSYGD